MGIGSSLMEVRGLSLKLSNFTLDGTAIVIIFVAYGLGCFSTAYYLVRLQTGQDIRTIGSGNVGAKNAYRVLGIPGFAITFLGDMLKGAIAVWLAITFNLSTIGILLVILAVVAGHIWPATLNFRGGKGASTALGAILVFDTLLGLILLGLAALTWALIRRFTLSGLIVIVAAPIITWVMGRSTMSVIGMTVLAFLLLIVHKDNIHGIIR